MIEIKGVTKKFGDFTALNNVSCRIDDGRIFGVVGSNGAGKSTLLRLVSGIYEADGGEVLIDGKNVYTDTELRNSIAFLSDEPYFFNNASMKRMAAFYSSVYANFDNEYFKNLAETFHLDIYKSINSFSKGMRRQAAIILALSSHPKYIFMDETFDGLDPVVRGLVKKLICNEVEQRGACAMLTSHSLRELEDLCDSLALIHNGGIIFESEINDLKTTLFKVQTAFLDQYDESRFRDFELLHFSKRGSVANMIVRGEKEAVVNLISKMNPVILDVLPLTLEEVFTYELEALGYVFDEKILNEEAEDEK